MKYMILLSFSLFPLWLEGQIAKKCWQMQHNSPEGYTLENAASDFRTALQNIDRDTTVEHLRHKTFIPAIQRRTNRLLNVYFFDSTAVIGKQSKGLLDSLLKAHIHQLEKTWLGTWDWAWSGYNGLTLDDGEFETDGMIKRRMLVTRDSISIYKNGLLESKEKYSLSVDYWSIGRDWFSIQMGAECWNLSLSPEPGHFRIRTKAAQFLNINRWQGCACGCPMDVFYRN